MIFLIFGFTFFVFFIVRAHYRVKDFDINIEKLLDWINDTGVTFFDNTKDKQTKRANLKKLSE